MAVPPRRARGVHGADVTFDTGKEFALGIEDRKVLTDQSPRSDHPIAAALIAALGRFESTPDAMRKRRAPIGFERNRLMARPVKLEAIPAVRPGNWKTRERC